MSIKRGTMDKMISAIETILKTLNKEDESTRD